MSVRRVESVCWQGVFFPCQGCVTPVTMQCFSLAAVGQLYQPAGPSWYSSKREGGSGLDLRWSPDGFVVLLAEVCVPCTVYLSHDVRGTLACSPQ